MTAGEKKGWRVVWPMAALYSAVEFFFSKSLGSVLGGYGEDGVF